MTSLRNKQVLTNRSGTGPEYDSVNRIGVSGRTGDRTLRYGVRIKVVEIVKSGFFIHYQMILRMRTFTH